MALGLALAALACAPAAPPPPQAPSATATDGPAGGDSCEARSSRAYARYEAILESPANQACTSDADCAAIERSSTCFDHCNAAIGKQGLPALTSVRADVDAHECKAFLAQGCRVEPPPCTPPTAPRCEAGRCG